MEPAKQYAYRTILYQAMLDLRISHYRRQVRWWNFKAKRQALRRLSYTAAVAEWLHNLAEFSRRDFERFDEKQFWDEYDQFERRYPEQSMVHMYRGRFESSVAEYDPKTP